jgi:outer membrane protein assembly factor BamB
MRPSRLLALLSYLLPCTVLGALPGGGGARQDCWLELDAPAPNYPISLPGKTKTPKEVRCFDGDAGCDIDGKVNGECRFPLDVCMRVSDPAVPECTPADVTSFAVAGTRGNADLAALQQAGSALLPATSSACTTGQSVRVPLRHLGKRGLGSARRSIKLKVNTSAGADSDRITFTCLKREWPTFGYDHGNTRATSAETTLSPANASQIDVKWTFDVVAHEGGGSGTVTSTPTVGNGMVFVTAWNGKVYGLRQRDGKVRWSYDSGSGTGLGLQSSATLTPEGRLLVGDSLGGVHCLVAKNGQLLWKATVGDTDPAASHVWASPVVALGRVFVGRASHSDQPCTQGHLYAFDLQTGDELWRYATVPAHVCRNDTHITCTTNDDCGGAECVPGVGGGVTATVVLEPTGKTVYMGAVGCYTRPSIGNSDALFSLDAATGAAHWIYRTESIEQYHDATPFYHDFGFLNGPILVDAADGQGGTRTLVLGASKDGTMYAVDPATGSLVWSYSLVPEGGRFAGFGLFNSAVAWTGHTIFASLYQTIAPNWPTSNDHLYAFSDLDGTPLWSAQIGPSWSSAAVANGLVFVGTNAANEYYVYDAATGARLKTVPMAGVVQSGASIVDGVVYVGYSGGIVALGPP